MLKKKLTLNLLTLLCALVLLIGVVFAYFTQLYSGWDHTVSSSSLTFLFNGQHFGNSIDSEHLKISKGEMADLDLKIEVKSNQSSVRLGYSINIAFSPKGGEGGYDDELAPAIEAYIFEENSYKSLGRLSDLITAGTETSGYTIKGYLPANYEYTYRLKLVYSPSAGSEYEGKTFGLTAVADICDFRYDDFNYIFVTDEESLTAALTNAANLNKTIYLLNDITLSGGVSISMPVSINLNGYKIKGAGSLTVKPAEEYEGAFVNCGFFDDASAFVGSAIRSGGSIDVPVTINTPHDFYSVNCAVSGAFNVIALSPSATAKAAQRIIDTYENITFRYGEDYYALRGMGKYIAGGHLAVNVTKGIFDNIDANGDCLGENLKIAYSGQQTVSVETEFVFATETGIASAGGVTVICGHDVRSIAEYILNLIPDPIVGSLFMPATDVVSGANISWFVPPQYSNYFDEHGVFLKDGYANLPSWDDADIELGIKISLNGEQYSVTVNRTVSVAGALTAAQRTMLIYTNKQIILQSTDADVSILGELKLGDLMGADNLAEILRISRLESIEIIGLENDDYLKAQIVTQNGLSHFTLTVINAPMRAFAEVDATLKFTYLLESGDKITYEITKTITVLGAAAEYSIDDSANFIQAEFEENNYTKGLGNSFTLSGNVKSGVLVEYVVDSQYSQYVIVNNGIYTALSKAELVSNNVYYVKTNAAGEPDPNGQYYAYFEYGSFYTPAGNETADGTHIALTFFDGTEKSYKYYEFSTFSASIYKRSATITVLYENVPSTNVTAIIRANFYEIVNVGDDIGSKIYKQDADGIIQYKFTLAVKGILHHRADEIADYNVYRILLTHFDKNANGYIERDEAALAPTGGSSDSTAQNGLGVSYANVLKFDSKSISTLKGLEYFTQITALNLSNNNIVDLSQLASLTKLKYLNLLGNNISSLSSLAYLDDLMYLSLRSNNITSLEPIQYLPSIQRLNISLNEQIADFSYLGGYKNLLYLNVRQNNGLYTNSTDATYYFALLAANIPGFTVHIVNDSSPTLIPDAEKAAAKAMSELIMAAQASSSLYVPTTCKYNNVTYKLVWITESASSLQFSYDNNGNYLGYTITAPIIQEAVRISLRVYIGNTEMATISRGETLTLLPSQSGGADAYIEYAQGQYALASEKIPDVAFRAVLFKTFNTDQSNTVPNGAPVGVTEKNLLSWAEINARMQFTFNWSRSGITSLEGIQYFANSFSSGTVSINLSDNQITDYEKLQSLIGVDILILGGQEYDFSRLVTIATDSNGYYNPAVTPTGLTNLTQLRVYGSYNLSDYNVLKGLFAVYLANNQNVNIFLENSSTAWTPIQTAIAQRALELPRLYSFTELGTLNILPDGSSSVNTVVYDLLLLTINITSVALNNVLIPQADDAGSTTSNPFITTSGLKTFSYVRFVPYTQTIYSTITLTGQGKTRTYGVQIALNYYDKFVLSGIESGSKYYDASKYVVDGANSGTLISSVFSSRSVRSAVIRQLSSRIVAGTLTKSAGGYYFVTLAQLEQWVTGTLSVDGSYFDGGTQLSGLELTGITALSFQRDAQLGNGTALVNIEQMVIPSGADFSTLNMQLTKLKHLYVGLATDFMHEAYAYSIFASNTLLLMPNLETLAIQISQTAKQFNWHFLNNTVSTNKISLLYLYENVAGILVGSTVMGYVANIYANSTATGKSYTIAGVPFEGDGSFETIYVIKPEMEYSEFASLIADAGVKAGSASSTAESAEFYAATAKQTYSAGEKIYLPYSTFNTGLGADFVDKSEFNRAFYIDWKIYGIFSVAKFNELFTISGATVTYTVNELFVRIVPTITGNVYNATYDGYITLTCKSADYYVCITGTIGVGYFAVTDNGDDTYSYTLTTASIDQTLTGVVYVYGYPVLLTGVTESIAGYVSYSKFADQNFRFYMFLGTLGAYTTNGYGVSYTGKQPTDLRRIQLSGYNTTTSGTYNISLSAFNRTVNSTNTVSAVMRALVNFPFNVYSLEGIENFTSLQGFQWQSDLICKLPQTWNNANMINFDVTNNLVSDLDCLAGLTNLQTLEISGNPLSDLSGIKNISTLRTLSMSYVSTLTPEILGALRNNTSITSLNISNCKGLVDAGETLDILKTMTGVSYNSFTFYTAVSRTGTLATHVQALLDVVGTPGNPIYDAVTGNISISDIAVEIIYGNYRAFVPAYIASKAEYYLNGAEVPLIVTDSGRLIASYTTKIENIGANRYTAGGQDCNAYDPYLWAYFATIYTVSNYEFTSSSTSLTISPSTFGSYIYAQVRSLKGLENITNLTSTLSITDVGLRSLWTGTMRITGLTLDRALVSTEDLYNALKLAPNVTSLQTRTSFNIDFTKEVESGKSIANQFFKNMDSLNISVHLNMSYNGANSWSEYLVEHCSAGTTTLWGATVKSTAMKHLAGIYYVDRYNSLVSVIIATRGLGVSTVNYYTITNFAALYQITSGTSANDRIVARVLHDYYSTTASLNSRKYYVTNLYSAVSRKLFPSTTVYLSTASVLTIKISYENFVTRPDKTLSFYLPKSVNFYINEPITYVMTTQAATNIVSANGLFNLKFGKNGTNTTINGVNITLAADKSFTFRVRIDSRFLTGGTVTPTYSIDFVITDIVDDVTYDFNYYIQTESGGDYRPATEVFESIELAYTIFERLGITLTEHTNAAGDICPSSISYNTLTGITSLSITSYPITSLKGLEYFTRLTSLTYSSNAAVISLEPLRNLSLTTFNIGATASTNSSFQIMDFSPLVAGSKNTLTTFSSNRYLYTPVTDLSFLLSMPELRWVTFYSDPSSNHIQSRMYADTPAFRYIVAAMQNKGMSVSFSAAQYGTISAPTAQERSAAETLAMLDGNVSFAMEDNYRLHIKNNSASERYLPGVINKHGKLYAVEWVAGYGTAAVERVAEHGNSGNIYTVVRGANVSKLTRAEVDLLLNDAVFVADYINGNVQVYVSVDLGGLPQGLNYNVAKLTARIIDNGYTFERMLTISKSA